MNEICAFELKADFEPKPSSRPLDPEAECDLSPMSVAMDRFEHRYFYSTVVMKARGHEDLMELAFEVAYALDQLPGWLANLMGSEKRAGLIFGAQGSERELVAERHGEIIRYWFRSFGSTGGDSPRSEAPARVFLRAWTALGGRLMEELVALTPELEKDPEFLTLRAEFGKLKRCFTGC